MSDTVKFEAYCVKCKQKRELVDPVPVFTRGGRPALEGRCSVCGSKMFRMGRTPLHEGLEPPPVEQRPRRAKKGRLVIVESPTKARTIGRFLGKDFVVKASVGHVRDLLRSQLSVDVDHDFAPKYRVPNEKRAVVKELAAAANRSAEVYLATDLDREGEAIAWHLKEVLKLSDDQTRRVVFHEITKSAIDEAFAHPRALDMNLVNAQQARRVLDRLVGYKLTPLLWHKVRSRLSAGRVQSVALRLIVEREREIESFVPREYWTIDAELQPATAASGGGTTFKARLVQIRGEDVEFGTQEDVLPVLDELERSRYVVSSVKRGTRRRRPAPPYTTSTLQQEASGKLRFAARKTMRIAQQLYEGVELGGGNAEGLITYMRTDSTHVAPQAQAEARGLIAKRFGAEYLPEKPPVYRTRSRVAQEAHEAIRPTHVSRTPESVKPYLSADQYRLYTLIWRRFIASQMVPAVYDTIAVEVLAGVGKDLPYLFRTSGSTLRFAGFLIVYGGKQGANGGKEEETQQIPPLERDQILALVRLLPEQHFTQPPPRYTDAALIKALEEFGIGRPSTYASILSTLSQRGYVERDGRRLRPTEIGKLVSDLLVEHFPRLINVDFTAQMEAELDEIASGDRDWVAVLREFYPPFKEALEKAEETIPKVEQVEYVGRPCPACEDGQLVVRWGRFGKFIGCSNYPTCRYTEPWLEKIGVKCPKCEDGEIVVRRTKRGRVFYGCSNYPECDFRSWKRPLPQRCPKCGGLLVISGKNTAQCTVCESTFKLDELPLSKSEPVKTV